MRLDRSALLLLQLRQFRSRSAAAVVSSRSVAVAAKPVVASPRFLSIRLNYLLILVCLFHSGKLRALL